MSGRLGRSPSSATVRAVSKEDNSPARAWGKWREAEGAYHDEVARFVDHSSDPPAMTKDDLIRLVQLRERADRWRERYFKRQRD